MLRAFIDKFLKRNKKSIDSDNILLEMNGLVLAGSNDADFDFKSTVIKEVTQYCKEQGILKVDRVIILSVYDTDIFNPKKKVVFEQKQVSKSESKIVVVLEDGKVIAHVSFSEYLEITGDN